MLTLVVYELSACMTSTGILPRKRALSGADIPAVNTTEILSEITNTGIKRARKRALSDQQVQPDALTKTKKLE